METLLQSLRDSLPGANTGERSAIDVAAWPEVIAAAITHRVEPLLYARALSPGAASAIPADQMKELEELYCCHALRNQQLFRQLSAEALALDARGIPVIALKGAFLAANVYADPAHRAMADVDLLVHATDLAGAESVLRENGYAPLSSAEAPTDDDEGPEELEDYAEHHHLQRMHKPGALPVEVHHTLAPARSGLRLDMDAVWKRARRASIGRAEVMALSPEDLLLHLCVHASYSHRFRVPIRSLYDIAVTVAHYNGELDWQLLERLAADSGAGPGVSCTLRVAESMFGVAIPETLTTGAAPEMRVSGALVDAAYAMVLAGPSDVPHAYQEAREIHGTAATLSVMRRTFFPPIEHLRQIYRLQPGSRVAAAYYIYRPLDLIVRRGRFALGVLMRTPQSRDASRASDQRRLIDGWIFEQEGRNAGVAPARESK